MERLWSMDGTIKNLGKVAEASELSQAKPVQNFNVVDYFEFVQ